jgi:hypothetical protein
MDGTIAGSIEQNESAENLKTRTTGRDWLEEEMEKIVTHFPSPEGVLNKSICLRSV